MKMSQDKLAQMSGCSPQLISKIEKGQVDTTVSTLNRIYTSLNIYDSGTEKKTLPFIRNIEDWLEELCEREPFRKDWFIGQFRDAFPNFVKWEEGKEGTEDSEDKFPTSKVA